MEIIAHIHTDFPTKFGVPRQSGVIAELRSEVVFTSKYRNPDAVRGLERFSHIWLIWCFSEAVRSGKEADDAASRWSATVRPPRLGGNKRVGVFATRSPFRPNPIGLSSVKLERVEMDEARGPVLHVLGADMIDGTPIYDIKPYLPFTDSHTEASGGFAAELEGKKLSVNFPAELMAMVAPAMRSTIVEVLAQDPRPAYQWDSERIYGVPFAGQDIRFSVNCGLLTVREIVPLD